MSAQKFYSISEAAQKLGISAKTLRRWDKAGKVKINRTPNGERIFTAEEIDKLRARVSPFSVQPAAQTELAPSSNKSSIHHPKYLIASVLVLIIALIYSIFILSFNLKQNIKF